MNCDEGYHGHAVCCEGDTTWDACGCGRGHQIRVLTRLAEQQVMMEAHTEASACSGEAPSTQAHGGMGIRKILGEIHESNHYLFQKMVVPREHTIHGYEFVCDFLENPAFFANECELFYADTVRHILQYLLSKDHHHIHDDDALSFTSSL
jgi:hypothetical protein